MRQPSAVLFTIALALPAAAGSPADVAGLVNARVETGSAAAGLDAEVRRVLASRSGPSWIGYSMPANGKHSMCCWSSSNDAGAPCGGCRLEGEKGEGAFRPEAPKAVALEGPARFRVLLRAEGGRVIRIRTMSEDCALDAGGLPFVWIESVRPAESVAYLASLVGSGPDGGNKGHGIDDGALAALAFHDDASADAVLSRFLDPAQPDERRRQAAFWMGQARGAKGLEPLLRLMGSDPSPSFREHLTFVLSQSRDPRAVDRLLAVAKRDDNAHVRGQALFWLAQTAARRATGAIESALNEDPEESVKKQAVFALTQLPKDEGVPILIRLARTHQSREVRKQAMFWLGQSGDARAIAFFEDVLKP